MAFSLKKIDPPVPLRSHVAASIREAILRGNLKPGQRLVERKLAAELGVSQIAVREALPELEHEGLLTRTPNVGAHVTEGTKSGWAGKSAGTGAVPHCLLQAGARDASPGGHY